MKISQEGLIGEYININQQQSQKILTVGINVVDMSLSLKVPLEIKAAVYQTKTYTYDSRNRLTHVSGTVSKAEAYGYDPVGNRLSSSISGQPAASYTHNNGNELITKSDTDFTYDANGNMIAKTDGTGTTTYTYNTENRLIRADMPDGRYAEYKYDPFGKRIEKRVTDPSTSTTTATKYVYDREDILFELDETGSIVTEYTHGPGIDEPIAMKRGGQRYYYHNDALGSITAITDESGNVIQEYKYDSYGNITYIKDPNFQQPYTYTGREYDPETGLYFLRARYYDPTIGRFLSRDPIGFNGGDVNLYGYVGNNPVNWIDPWGLKPGDPYSTMDNAGINAISDTNPTSISQNLEHGGYVYQQ